MVYMIVRHIFHPDPPRFRGQTMNTIIPLEVGDDGQAHSDHSPGDGLDAGRQAEHGEGMHHLLYLTAHPHMVDQVT